MFTKIKDAVQNLNKITLNDSDLMGKGSYAEVYRYSIQNIPIAVKCFDNEEEAIKEMEVIQKIQAIATNCPGIINYYGMKKLEIEIIGGVVTQNYSGYAIFLEQCQSDLARIKKLQIKEIFNLLSQISLSLFCLHSQGCFHGDLKPANILVNKKNQQQLNYYLTDYGEGKCIEELITTNYKTLTMRGTQFYFSPELWNIFNTRANFGRYNPLAADIYTLGIICIELLLGSQFIQKLNMERTQEQQYKKELQIIKQQLLKIPEFKQNPNNPLLITLLKMVSFHQKERPQAIEICQALISSQFFFIDALEVNNLKALIIQLISSYNPIIKINNTNDSKEQLLPNPVQKIQTDLQTFTIPTFQSDIIKDSTYTSLILSLFDDSNIKLSRIHHQIKEFNPNKFHSDCDKKGSTLVIMHSSTQPNCFFGGMAVPSWQSPDNCCHVSDPAEQSSWLFKIELLEGKKINLHQWKCINKSYAIFCHKTYGPYFGGYYTGYTGGTTTGGLRVLDNYSYSELPSNNEYYQKQNLAGKLKDQKNLLFSLSKTVSINCPEKVIGEIMNEKYTKFELSECEVFTVKK